MSQSQTRPVQERESSLIRSAVQILGAGTRLSIAAIAINFVFAAFADLSEIVMGILRILFALALMFFGYKFQRKTYGDSHVRALIKCIILGLSTALPWAIAGLVASPMGILGLFHNRAKATKQSP